MPNTSAGVFGPHWLRDSTVISSLKIPISPVNAFAGLKLINKAYSLPLPHSLCFLLYLRPKTGEFETEDHLPDPPRADQLQFAEHCAGQRRGYGPERSRTGPGAGVFRGLWTYSV